MTTGMITSFSLPGLPSPLSLRIPLVSEACAIPRADIATEPIPRADKTEANRAANVRRLTVRFICLLLSIENLLPQREAEDVASRGDCHVLLAFHRVGHRRRTYVLPRVEMPHRFAGLRLNGLKESRIIAEKHEASGGCHGPPGRMRSARLGISPHQRSRLHVVCQKILSRSLS